MGAPSKTALVSGSFTVPSSATTGSTRMRVSMSAGGVPSACETSHTVKLKTIL
jgi:hypothetical protein